MLSLHFCGGIALFGMIRKCPQQNRHSNGCLGVDLPLSIAHFSLEDCTNTKHATLKGELETAFLECCCRIRFAFD